MEDTQHMEDDELGSVEEFAEETRASIHAATPSSPQYRDDDENEQPNRGLLVQWCGFGPNQFVAAEQSWVMLPSAVYTQHQDDNGRLFFRKQIICIDDLLLFPSSVTDNLLQEIHEFWEKSALFAQHGFCHRRGVLLYGPQGCGKTSCVLQMIGQALMRNSVVFLCHEPQRLARALAVFRQVEPKRDVVCVFEDIDAIIQRHGEEDLLSLLDGESQINHVLNIATTNYPERLNKRLVSRPRRFDRIFKIAMPEEVIRRFYFQKKLSTIPQTEIDALVQMTKGLSLASLAEVIISVKCLGKSLEETVQILHRMSVSTPSSQESVVGFGER